MNFSSKIRLIKRPVRFVRSRVYDLHHISFTIEFSDSLPAIGLALLLL